MKKLLEILKLQDFLTLVSIPNVPYLSTKYIYQVVDE
jgi:hypothetical protein